MNFFFDYRFLHPNGTTWAEGKKLKMCASERPFKQAITELPSCSKNKMADVFMCSEKVRRMIFRPFQGSCTPMMAHEDVFH